MTGEVPHLSHRPQALPDHGLRIQAVNQIRKIGRVTLFVQQSALARRDLAAEIRRVSSENRCRLGNVGPVAEAAVIKSRTQQLLTHLPVGVDGEPLPQGGPEDCALVLSEAVGAHDPGAVDVLGKLELLVGVAHAVSPRQLQVLNQQVALCVQHSFLRHDKRRAL